MAPSIILGDRTLRDLTAIRPSSIERLRAVSGIGEVRLREHGKELLRARTSRTTAAKTEAIRLLQEGRTIETVMERTGRARSTVVGDLCEMIEGGRYRPSLSMWMSRRPRRPSASRPPRQGSSA